MAGQLDEPALEPILPRLPGEIKRVDGDAVAAQPWAWIERHETERLRLRRVDDLPDVDVHLARHERDLIHQSDIDRPERVFEQLDHLRNARRADLNDALDR